MRRKKAKTVWWSARMRAGLLVLLAAITLAMAADYPRLAVAAEDTYQIAADPTDLSCRLATSEPDVAVDQCCRPAGTCAISLPPKPMDVGVVLIASRLSMNRGDRDPPSPSYRPFKPPRLQTRA